VNATALTANAAFVQTLYLDFLHRTGDVSNPQDAGSWVTALNQGKITYTAVANAIAHSLEGLGVQVDRVYHRFLGRDADPAGRASAVGYLQAGGTLEGVSRAILASQEYGSRFPSDSSFVESLYQNLLHRTGSSVEVSAWVGGLPQLGRAGVAQAFLSSTEYRSLEVGAYYANLLHRTSPPAASELAGWVNSPLDLFSIESRFAGTPEFQLKG
jgi:hypothetical protein